MSTYSPSLRIELITTGDQAGTWGTTTNTNLGTLIESGICGYTSVSVTSANQALTALNGVADESRNMVLALTTTTTANFNVYAPPAEKVYVVYNASAYTATIYNSTVIGNTTAAGTGVSVPAGKTMTVWSDGTNFATQNTHLSSVTLGTDLAVADGGTGASTASSARSNLGAAASGANSDITSLSGLTTALSIAQGGTGQTTANAAFNALAPSQSAQSGKYLKTDGTNTSWDQLDISTADITGTLPLANGGTGATTAANARTNLGLGSLATLSSIDNSNWSGTDLSIANGGTGASDAATARSNLGLGSLATASSIDNSNWSGVDLSIANGGTGASDAATARSNLGVTATGQDTTYAFRANNLSDLASASSARINLGLGSMATQNSNSVSISGGSVTGITDLAVADGGTGASTAANARTNLDVPSTSGSGASGTWGISISGNAATSSDSLGNGQTWQAPSRAPNTSYQNTTGRSIQVSCATSATLSSFQVSPDNSTWQTAWGGGTVGFAKTATVRSGYYYRLVNDNSQLSWWYELS